MNHHRERAPATCLLQLIMGSQCCALQSCHQHACSSSLMLPGGSALNMMKRQKLCMHWFIFRTRAIIVNSLSQVSGSAFNSLRLAFCAFVSGFRNVLQCVCTRRPPYICIYVRTWGEGAGYWFEYDRVIKVLRNWRFGH